MTSGKMRRYELIAREEWKKGLELRGLPEPTGSQVEAFKMGFSMSWKIILTREKLYQTFNIHWEKLEEVSHILINNDGFVLARINCYPVEDLRFKYHLTGSCGEIDFYYSERVDMNDIDRLERRLKQEILEKYIRKKKIVNEVNIIHLD